MLRVLGSARRLCGGVRRREMLQAGGLLTLSAADLWRAQAVQAAGDDAGPGFASAKRIILLYLYGAAAQHELWDLKPEAPAEIRGDFVPIATSLPGFHLCEHLPRLAALADRITFIRSMTHPYNIHSAAYSLTGVDTVDIPMELNPHDQRHWPFFGSVLEYLHRQQSPGGPLAGIPRNIALPFLFSSRCDEFDRGGPFGGFLGKTYDPVWTEFEGAATRDVLRWRGNDDQNTRDPYAGITPDSRFTVSQTAQLPVDVTVDRLNRRRSLLTQIDAGVRELDRSLTGRSLDRFQQMAYALLTSPELPRALDVSQEPADIRERYGMTLFGQATLAGRRLLEAGAQLVTVIWDEYGTANSAWDTHFNHFERLKGELLPGLDAALSALLLDLAERGMFDDTLVLCLTEHGRTPRLSTTPRGAGREHWSQTYCNLLAGAGIARGRVVGRSDAQGAYVEERPVSPKEILATLYHVMGVDPHTTIPDRLGRPLPLVSGGSVAGDLLA